MDFYEACVEQLKRELPKYLNKQNESDKYHRNFAKTLRAVASSEPNQRLRDLLFLYSQKHETFEKEREIFSTCDKAAHAIIEEARTMLIHPVKVRVAIASV